MTQDPPESMTPEAEDALRDSIAEFGVLVPVCLAPDGTVVEGRHRARLATELNVDYPYWVVRNADTAERNRLAQRLNSDRQSEHLPVEERDRLVLYLLQLRHSQRAIARALRVGKNTITRIAATGPELAVEVIRPDRDGTGQRASSLGSSRFVSTLAELVAACTALAETPDLTSVLSPQDAQQWNAPITRATSALRILQTRMREHAQR
ncbi:ParB/RepB/Spo0J family partition protein [Nocardiopsis dassonvillei]